MNDRDRRALRLGMWALLGGAVLFRGLPAGWHAWREAQGALTERQELLARARMQVDAIPVLDSLSDDVRRRFLALAPRLVPGRTTAEAEGSLGGVLSLLAERSRLRVRRLESVADSARAGRLRGVAVALEVEGDWAGATAFMRAVARESVSLSLGELTVHTTDPTSGQDRAEVLVIQAELHGWYLGEGGR